MKKTLYLLSGLLLMLTASCGGRQEKTELTVANDSLSTVIGAKDSIIIEVFSSLNDIVANLNAIKERENIVTGLFRNEELQTEPTLKIKEDISALDKLLVANRNTIRKLEANISSLKKSSVRIPHLDNLLSELKTQLADRDIEIRALKTEVEAMYIQVDSLKIEVNDLNGRNSALENEIENTTEVLNNAYYIVGSQKELLDKGIVYKSGFIGKTLKINENRSLDDFTRVDIRKFNEIILGKQNVRIISAHPDASYEAIMKDKNTTSSIVILDKAKFWEYSKVLVIVYKD